MYNITNQTDYRKRFKARQLAEKAAASKPASALKPPPPRRRIPANIPDDLVAYASMSQEEINKLPLKLRRRLSKYLRPTLAERVGYVPKDARRKRSKRPPCVSGPNQIFNVEGPATIIEQPVTQLTQPNLPTALQSAQPTKPTTGKPAAAKPKAKAKAKDDLFSLLTNGLIEKRS